MKGRLSLILYCKGMLYPFSSLLSDLKCKFYDTFSFPFQMQALILIGILGMTIQVSISSACATFKMQDSCLTITCSFCSNNAPWARSVLRFLCIMFSPEYTTALYISQIEGFLFNNPSFFAVEHMESCSYRTWEWAGKRKRGPKSSGNGNMEESLSCLFPPPETEVEAWSGVSQCLPFLLFLSAPSFSFWLTVQLVQ